MSLTQDRPIRLCPTCFVMTRPNPLGCCGKCGCLYEESARLQRDGWCIDRGADGGFLLMDDGTETCFGWLERSELVALHELIGDALSLHPTPGPDA